MSTSPFIWVVSTRTPLISWRVRSTFFKFVLLPYDLSIWSTHFFGDVPLRVWHLDASSVLELGLGVLHGPGIHAKGLGLMDRVECSLRRHRLCLHWNCFDWIEKRGPCHHWGTYHYSMSFGTLSHTNIHGRVGWYEYVEAFYILGVTKQRFNCGHLYKGFKCSFLNNTRRRELRLLFV